VRLWAADGRPLDVASRLTSVVIAGAFSPAADSLALVTDVGRKHVWNLFTGRLVFTAPGRTFAVFSPDGRVHLTLLTSAAEKNSDQPTKENLQRAFETARKSRLGDFFVVYLAGHGTGLRQGDSELYCYLTQEARSLDPPALADSAVRGRTSVTSEELVDWIKRVPALKQVLVLDTCAAGAAASKLTESRAVSGDQVRAIERLKDRTGFHVLMGCAADRVSYEASQYAQGLLTYSLLEGMRGAALRRGEYEDVSKLFQYAADRVPELARGIGGVQKPRVAAPRGDSFDTGDSPPPTRRRCRWPGSSRWC
jgi:hypothetical protein